MEVFELRYFLAVAEFENIHRASEKLRISPASLSKAVARLESELGVNLFQRKGRGIFLSEAGRVLQEKGSEISHLEEALRVRIRGGKSAIQVRIAGPEVLLTPMGLKVADDLRARYPESVFTFEASEDRETIRKVEQGEVHLGLVTCEPPKRLSAKVLAQAKFQTCVGEGHPLYRKSRSKNPIPVEEALEFPFVSPATNFLGQIGANQSADGWRDDQFPRKIAYRVTGLTLLEEIVQSGRALAYLPDYRVGRAGLGVLTITGCPYSCTQKIRMVARNPRDLGWLSSLF